VTYGRSVVFSGSSINKTDCHDITEILLKVVLSTITLTLTLRIIKLYNICIYSENINVFVQALERNRKVCTCPAFLSCCLQRVQMHLYFLTMYMHCVYILQCPKVHNNCHILPERGKKTKQTQLL
jgi:hypothetical protein